MASEPNAPQDCSDRYRIQDDLYTFPYHHIPHFDNKGIGVRFRTLHRGFEYLCYLRHIREIVQSLVPSSILEIGCSDGRLVGMLDWGIDRRVGIDLSKKAVLFAKAFNPEIEFLSVDARKLKERFDIVLASVFTRLSKVLSRKRLYPFLKREYNQISKNSRVLIIGAGGRINRLLEKYAEINGFEILSIDIDEKKRPDIFADLCTHDFGELKFDVVVMGEVLEHLHSPHLAIKRIHNALRPNGKLIITVPFIFPIHDRPYDYYRYTRYGLEFLLREFNDVSITERNNWGEAINVLFVRHIMEKNICSRLVAPIFVVIAFINLPVLWLLGYLIKTNFITSGYVVTAKK